MTEKRMNTGLTVNGQHVQREIPVRQHLVDFLREDLGLTGSHLGCEYGVCGACQVMVDGQLVRGCLTLAVQMEGKTVDTVEGLSDRGDLQRLQQAFLEHNALQCGFCTSGMLLTRWTWYNEIRVPVAMRYGNIFQATTAAVQVTRPLWMPSNQCCDPQARKSTSLRRGWRHECPS